VVQNIEGGGNGGVLVRGVDSHVVWRHSTVTSTFLTN
jgi:hypothetical protein